MCFRPDTQALRLQNVNLYCLRHVGVKVLLLDADNTLSPWNSPELSPEVVEWVEGAKAAGFAVLVASNNSLKRLMPLTEKLRIGAVPRANKPLPFKLKKAAKALGFAPRQCAMCWRATWRACTRCCSSPSTRAASFWARASTARWKGWCAGCGGSHSALRARGQLRGFL